MSRRGEHVVLRQLFVGRIWNAMPAVVVEQTPERLVTWLPPGVVTKSPEGGLFDGWTLRDRLVRRPHGILRVKEPAEEWSLLHFWHEDGSFAGWYVNLEGPFLPTPIGWDYEDHLLDLWLEAEGKWEWLDEDELARAVELGLRSEEEARAARAAGERALARLLAAEPPDRTGLEAWRPDPAWALPALPPNWDAAREPPGALR